MSGAWTLSETVGGKKSFGGKMVDQSEGGKENATLGLFKERFGSLENPERVSNGKKR